MKNLKALNIGGLNIEIPIIQGGMGVGVSLSGLASAVAQEGGVGVISPAGIGLLYKEHSNDYLKNSTYGLACELKKAKAKTKGVIGVNIMVALSNYAELVETAIEEKADIIFSGAGLPLDLPKYLTPGSITRLVPIVSSARAAELICKKWDANYHYTPDAIVVEGPKAGGHLGFKEEDLFNEDYSLEKLIPEVVAIAKQWEEKSGKSIPVIAAGGIYSGEEALNIMACGAAGVQMGTRFVTTDECDASVEFKNAYLKAKKEDIRIIKSPVGMPGRAIACSFLDDVVAGIRQPKKCPVNCIKTCNIESAPYCIIASLTSALKGNFKNGYAFAGSNVWRNDRIVSVKEMISNFKDEFILAAQQLMQPALV